VNCSYLAPRTSAPLAAAAAATEAAAARQGMSTRAERRALQTQQRNQKALGQMVAERTCEIVLVRHGETAYNAEERLQARGSVSRQAVATVVFYLRYLCIWMAACMPERLVVMLPWCRARCCRALG